METDDYQGTDGEISDDRVLDTVKSLAAVEHSKEETDVYRIEKYNMQQMLTGIICMQMPGEKENAGCKA